MHSRLVCKMEALEPAALLVRLVLFEIRWYLHTESQEPNSSPAKKFLTCFI